MPSSPPRRGADVAADHRERVRIAPRMGERPEEEIFEAVAEVVRAVAVRPPRPRAGALTLSLTPGVVEGQVDEGRRVPPCERRLHLVDPVPREVVLERPDVV